MPPVVNGTLAGWILQPGYPRIHGERNNESITVVYQARWTNIWDNVPEYGTGYSAPEIGITTQFDYLKLVTFDIESVEGCGGVMAEITLVYKDPAVAESTNRDTSERWSCRNERIEVNIENKSNYKTNWNYALIAKKGVTETAPSWWETATDRKITIGQYESEAVYKWIKQDEQIPDGWFEVKPAQKKGVEAFPMWVPVATRRKYYTSEDAVNEDAERDGWRVSPSKTFGKPGGTDHWVQAGTEIEQEGKYWVSTTAYQYSDEVDTDIYDQEAS